MNTAHHVVRRALIILSVAMLSASAGIAQDRGPQPVSAADLQAAIDRLGSLEYEVRTNAARTVRRTPAAQAVPALLQAAAEHKDGYVRFRALVLLAGFNDPRANDAMAEASADPNDRLREVAYAYFEHHPDPARVPALMSALQREQAEFVRPRLVRALAAHGSDPQVRETLLRETARGEDFFRSAVIASLGDYKADYAVPGLVAVVRLEGPLQDDAALALGKIGDRKALETLVGLQRSAPRETQPAIATAICLLGVNCGSHAGYLEKTLRFAEKYPGYQELVRGAATGLGVLGTSGQTEAITALLDVGIPSQDPARAPIALALATVAIRNTPLMLAVLEKLQPREPAVELLREGFDMLEEHFEEEQFFVTVRRAYWASDDGSEARKVAGMLVQKLEF